MTVAIKGNADGTGSILLNGVEAIGLATTGALSIKSTIDYAPTAVVASASLTNIASTTSNVVSITGGAAITGLGTAAAGATRFVKFAGTATLTHNAASLMLPSAANIVTAAGDTATFISEGSGNWTCVSYTKANGAALGLAVTSLNGQSGAVVTTSAYAIGSFVNGRPKNATSYAVGATIAGSSLWSTCSGAMWDNSVANWQACNFSRTTDAGVGAALVNTGTWLCVSSAPLYSGSLTLSGLWVRVS